MRSCDAVRWLWWLWWGEAAAALLLSLRILDDRVSRCGFPRGGNAYMVPLIQKFSDTYHSVGYNKKGCCHCCCTLINMGYSLVRVWCRQAPRAFLAPPSRAVGASVCLLPTLKSVWITSSENVAPLFASSQITLHHAQNMTLA